ncbi:MAG: twin-arginine translocase subunit TatC [Salinigranum sp.]
MAEESEPNAGADVADAATGSADGTGSPDPADDVATTDGSAASPTDESNIPTDASGSSDADRTSESSDADEASGSSDADETTESWTETKDSPTIDAATPPTPGSGDDTTDPAEVADGPVADVESEIEGVDDGYQHPWKTNRQRASAPVPDPTASEFVAPHPDAVTAAESAAATAAAIEDGYGPVEGYVPDDPDPEAAEAEAVYPDDPAYFTDDGADSFDEPSYLEDDGILGSGPEGDEEMPLTDHIEEMVRRLGIVFLFGIGAALLVYPFADQIINYLWNTLIPGAATIEGRRPRVYGPLELILTELKVSGLVGFVVGLPVFVYETYRFMKPGLYPRERRYYLASIPTSLVLAVIGVAFAYFVVLPAVFAYFTSYTQGTAVIAFSLKETFRLILLLMGYMALVFQIPLFIMLAIMMGLVTREWLTDKRILFWGGFLGLSFLVSPDPTGMAPIIVAATMIGLFEGTLLLLRWTGN